MLNVSDVSGKRSIDAQIMQNQRLEAIGQFAGGIAHDFNNLLTAIHGFAELALGQPVEDDPARDDLDQVFASAERASAITRKLLAFTRRQVLLRGHRPGQVITDLVPMLRPLLGDDIELTVDDCARSRLGPGRSDPARAGHREPGGQRSRCHADWRDARDRGPRPRPRDPERPDADLTAGPFVRITVSGHGFGMDEETKARIFDPFFTTKTEGKGTGLGLSTVFGIVAQSGGQISVETAPGAGATFHIDLPRVDFSTT